MTKQEEIIKSFANKVLENSFEVETKEYGRIAVVGEDTIVDEIDKFVEKIEPKTEMTKEQQIKEMVDFIMDSMLLGHNAQETAEHLINTGYRKKEEIEKQVAKEIYKKVLECYKDPDYDSRNPYDCNALVAYNRIMVIIKRDYGIEVEE